MVPAPQPAGGLLCPPERARSQQTPGDPPRAHRGRLTGSSSSYCWGPSGRPHTPLGHARLDSEGPHIPRPGPSSRVLPGEVCAHAMQSAVSTWSHVCTPRRPRSEVLLCWGLHPLGQSSLRLSGCFHHPQGQALNSRQPCRPEGSPGPCQ